MSGFGIRDQQWIKGLGLRVGGLGFGALGIRKSLLGFRV